MPVLPATPLAFSSSLLSAVGAGELNAQHLQAELATGSSILAPSDNPPAAVETLNAQASLAQANTWVASAGDGLSRLGLAASILNSVLEQISAVQQAVESTSTAQFSPVGMSALATKIQGIGQSLLANANTSYEGYAIFAGTSGAADAFDSSGNYLGNATVATRTVGPGIQLPVGMPGDQVFGNGSSGLFGAINQTVADLQAGNAQAVLGKDLAAINGWYATIQSAAAQIGAQYDQMNVARQQAQSTVQALTAQVGNLTEVDLPQAITQLSLQRSSLQAALYSLARAVPETLLPYLP